jgi:hypothetical protein
MPAPIGQQSRPVTPRQTRELPSSTPSSAPTSAPPAPPAATLDAFDSKPAFQNPLGWVSGMKAALTPKLYLTAAPGAPITPAIRGEEGARNPLVYDGVLDQFNVAVSPRYEIKADKKTHCNTYVWDATKAMGCEIPIAYDPKTGAPGKVNPKAKSGESIWEPPAKETNANGQCAWLNKHGKQNGWRPVSPEEAQARANAGYPTVLAWENPDPKGSGHVAMVRPDHGPGPYDPKKGPLIAQAGTTNFEQGYAHPKLTGIPDKSKIQYWTHD